jgi:hypothetical protein
LVCRSGAVAVAPVEESAHRPALLGAELIGEGGGVGGEGQQRQDERPPSLIEFAAANGTPSASAQVSGCPAWTVRITLPTAARKNLGFQGDPGASIDSSEGTIP